MIAFLDAHPAPRTTNRRRLSAIRWIHRHAGQLAPHRTTELRSRVLPPTDRTIDTDTIRPILEQMPTSGWTAGLVGRRDALLLVAGHRRRDTQRLAGLEDSFDDIERRATDLANWVASLIATADGDTD